MINEVLAMTTITIHDIPAKIFCLTTADIIDTLADMFRDETISTKIIPKCIKDLSQLKHDLGIESARNIYGAPF